MTAKPPARHQAATLTAPHRRRETHITEIAHSTETQGAPNIQPRSGPQWVAETATYITGADARNNHPTERPQPAKTTSARRIPAHTGRASRCCLRPADSLMAPSTMSATVMGWASSAMAMSLTRAPPPRIRRRASLPDAVKPDSANSL